MKHVLTLLLTALLVSGCAHVISEDMRSQVDRSITLETLFSHPEEYAGKTVILGGSIVSAKNTQEGTYIEAVERQLDYRGRPKHTDRSHGRFILFHEGFLDTAIFAEGKYITVAGEVKGKQAGKIGEMDYSFLLITSREIHLVIPGERYPVRFGIGIGHTF